MLRRDLLKGLVGLLVGGKTLYNSKQTILIDTPPQLKCPVYLLSPEVISEIKRWHVYELNKLTKKELFGV